MASSHMEYQASEDFGACTNLAGLQDDCDFVLQQFLIDENATNDESHEQEPLAPHTTGDRGDHENLDESRSLTSTLTTLTSLTSARSSSTSVHQGSPEATLSIGTTPQVGLRSSAVSQFPGAEQVFQGGFARQHGRFGGEAQGYLPDSGPYPYTSLNRVQGFGGAIQGPSVPLAQQQPQAFPLQPELRFRRDMTLPRNSVQVLLRSQILPTVFDSNRHNYWQNQERSMTNPEDHTQAGGFGVHNLRYRNQREAEEARIAHLRRSNTDIIPDLSIPETDGEKRLVITKIMRAMMCRQSVIDNVSTQNKWYQKLDKSLEKVEQGAWLFLNSMLEYHSFGGARDCTTKSNEMNERFVGNFARHLSEVCRILKASKTVAHRSLGSFNCIDLFVDDPAESFKRIRTNKKTNDNKALMKKEGDRLRRNASQASTVPPSQRVTQGTKRPRQIADDDEEVEDEEEDEEEAPPAKRVRHTNAVADPRGFHQGSPTIHRLGAHDRPRHAAGPYPVPDDMTNSFYPEPARSVEYPPQSHMSLQSNDESYNFGSYTHDGSAAQGSNPLLGYRSEYSQMAMDMDDFPMDPSLRDEDLSYLTTFDPAAAQTSAFGNTPHAMQQSLSLSEADPARDMTRLSRRPTTRNTKKESVGLLTI